MESPEKLFNAGKFVECSQVLKVLLNTEASTPEETSNVKFLYHYQHNKIVADALSYNWFDEEANVNELQQVWCSTFTRLTRLCDKLKCDLLTSNSDHEVFLVATLNLLSWSWENLGDHFDGYIDQVNRLTMYSLQTELSLCGESALDPESILDLVELYKESIWRIPPQRCHVLLDAICIHFLHMLRFESCEKKLTRCSKILQGLFEIIPQIYIHLTSITLVQNSPALFLLGPNIASSVSDPNLSVNLAVITTILYLLKLNHSDTAWHLLQKNSCAKNEKLEVILEYLKALVCLRRNELDRAIYHINCVSILPMEAHMVKRKNIFCGYAHILKGNHETSLQCLRDSTGLQENEDQLPIHVYLMAQSFGSLGQLEQQLVLLDCIAEVLREDPRYATGRVTPISSLQDRLLRSLHQQPELSLFQTLLALAEVSIKTSQPEKASEYLLEALRQTNCCPEFQEKPCDFVKVRSPQSVMKDAVVALVKCGDFSKARILCNGLTESTVLKDETFLNQAITRLLVSDVQPNNPPEKKQAILLDAIKLLKKQKEVSLETPHVGLIDSLLARTFYRKAKLYVSSGYNEDATTYFKRALELKDGDAVILQEYHRHLFAIGKIDDAKTLFEKIRDEATSSQPMENSFSEGYITLNYLVNEKVEEIS